MIKREFLQQIGFRKTQDAPEQWYHDGCNLLVSYGDGHGMNLCEVSVADLVNAMISSLRQEQKWAAMEAGMGLDF